jgi:hypothetical protein
MHSLGQHWIRDDEMVMFVLLSSGLVRALIVFEGEDCVLMFRTKFHLNIPSSEDYT